MPKKAMEILTESMFYVLMAFSKRAMCGIDVADYIEKRTKGRILIGPATLYTILGKFEKEKWIQEIEVEDLSLFGCPCITGVILIDHPLLFFGV